MDYHTEFLLETDGKLKLWGAINKGIVCQGVRAGCRENLRRKCNHRDSAIGTVTIPGLRGWRKGMFTDPTRRREECEDSLLVRSWNLWLRSQRCLNREQVGSLGAYPNITPPPFITLTGLPTIWNHSKPGQDGEGDLELPMEAVPHIGVHSHSLNGQMRGNARFQLSNTSTGSPLATATSDCGGSEQLKVIRSSHASV